MGHSFGGIGQWAATFACSGAVQEAPEERGDETAFLV